MTLWHYTCEHARPLIIADGALRTAAVLRPEADLPPVAHVIWATDLSRPLVHALGLANLSGRVICNRAEHRFRVLNPDLFTRWVMLPRDVRRAHGPIATTPGARPAHWWVAGTDTVPVVYDPLESP